MAPAVLVIGVLAAVAIAILTLSAAAATAPVYRHVRVDAKDFSFKLSRRSVPAGTTVNSSSATAVTSLTTS